MFWNPLLGAYIAMCQAFLHAKNFCTSLRHNGELQRIILSADGSCTSDSLNSQTPHNTEDISTFEYVNLSEDDAKLYLAQKIYENQYHMMSAQKRIYEGQVAELQNEINNLHSEMKKRDYVMLSLYLAFLMYLLT